MQTFLSHCRAFRVSSVGLAAALLFAGCGGGGGSSSPGLPSAPTSPTGPSSTAHAPANVTLTFLQYQPVKTTSAVRRASFISPATKNVKLGVVSVNGAPITNPTYTTIPVGATASGCTASGAQVTCSVSLDAPVGNDVISITTLDQSFAPLGTTLAPASIQQNATNVVPLSVGGTIANLKIFLTQYSFTAGASTTPGTALVVVVPIDPSGAVIVNPGNYTTPITLSLTGGTSAFSLVLNGTNSGASATLTSPNDQAILSFAGSPTTISTVLKAQSGTVQTSASASAYAAGAPGLTVVPSGTSVVSATQQFVFNGISGSGTLTVSGGVPPYTATSSDSTVATVSGSGTSFTVTPVGYGTNGLGSATITVTDSQSIPATYSIPVTVQTQPITFSVINCGINVNNCTSTGASYPAYSGGGVQGLTDVTIQANGGNGTYSAYFATTGTSMSPNATLNQSGNQFMIQETGAGNDVLVVTSGAQTAIYTLVEPTQSPLAPYVPTSVGLIRMLNAGGVGKTYSLALQPVVTSVTVQSGPTDENFTLSSNTLTATPVSVGMGTLSFSDASGNSVNSVPFAIFGVTFPTYAGTGITSHVDSSGGPADEQFTATGQNEVVTVSGDALPLTVTSSAPNVVSISGVGSSHFTATANNAGFATITIADSNGTSASYLASVTTTTIPIASRARSR